MHNQTFTASIIVYAFVPKFLSMPIFFHPLFPIVKFYFLYCACRLGTCRFGVSFETVKFACMNGYIVHNQTLTASVIVYAFVPQFLSVPIFFHPLFPIVKFLFLYCTAGVERTRRFLLEWLSYCCRYIPVGLLDVVPQRLNWRPPSYYGRDELETLMASDSAADWVCSSLSFQIINFKSLSVNFFREIEFMERHFLSCAASNSRTCFFY